MIRYIAITMAACACTTATAQVAEVRVGIGEFAQGIVDLGTQSDSGAERSLALQGEVVFDEPEFLRWALSPQPYINATLNLEGETNFLGAGLLWRQSLGEKTYADFAAGGSIHDGSLDIDVDDFVDADGFDFIGFFDERRERREYGTRALFRLQGTLGYRFTEEWAAELFFEHVSNGSGTLYDRDFETFGELLRSRDNDAADTLGVRASRRF